MRQFGVDKNGAECKGIRPHLKQIDHLFDIVFNYDTESYEVYFNGLFEIVKWNEFDKSTIENIRKAYWINVNGDPIKEMEENNARLDKHKENERDDLMREFAKDARKAILKEV